MKPTALLPLPGAALVLPSELEPDDVEPVFDLPHAAANRARARTAGSRSLLRCTLFPFNREPGLENWFTSESAPLRRHRRFEDGLQSLRCLRGASAAEHDEDGDDQHVGDGVEGELVD